MAEDDMNPFPTPDQLNSWLHAQQIDTSRWGEGEAKSVADLWQELQHGESTLQGDPALRRVRVAEVYVVRGDQFLIERAQHFADGRIRSRNRPPSEKMHPNETSLAAAQRCLIEELAVDPTTISIASQQIAIRTIRKQSDSYPNLLSEYTFYTVYTQVDSLPSGSFVTPNAAHSDGDPVIAHQWDWVTK